MLYQGSHIEITKSSCNKKGHPQVGDLGYIKYAYISTYYSLAFVGAYFYRYSALDKPRCEFKRFIVDLGLNPKIKNNIINGKLSQIFYKNITTLTDLTPLVSNFKSPHNNLTLHIPNFNFNVQLYNKDGVIDPSKKFIVVRLKKASVNSNFSLENNPFQLSAWFNSISSMIHPLLYLVLYQYNTAPRAVTHIKAVTNKLASSEENMDILTSSIVSMPRFKDFIRDIETIDIFTNRRLISIHKMPLAEDPKALRILIGYFRLCQAIIGKYIFAAEKHSLESIINTLEARRFFEQFLTKTTVTSFPSFIKKNLNLASIKIAHDIFMRAIFEKATYSLRLNLLKEFNILPWDYDALQYNKVFYQELMEKLQFSKVSLPGFLNKVFTK